MDESVSDGTPIDVRNMDMGSLAESDLGTALDRILESTFGTYNGFNSSV